MTFFASCSLFSVEPDATTAPPAGTTSATTGAASGEKCYFEVIETGVSALPGATRVYRDGAVAANGTRYPEGTVLDVSTSASSDLTFVGWSLDKSVDAGGEVVSTELTYRVRLSGKQVRLYANFVSPYPAVTALTYHLNGGTAGGKETVVDTVDTAYYTSPNTRYDDGSFTRDGYVLLEYNTKADGTGDAFSPGSKANPVDGKLDLYCIWAPVSSGFETENVTVNYGKKNVWGVYPYSYPGVAITGYTGDDETLVIPEKIGGKDVVSIKAGAISNKNFTTLVLPRTLRKIEDGAFTGCSSLRTVYMGDGILSITNAAFDAATYTNWTEFRLSATTGPRYASDYNGGYRIKWDRLMRGAASGKKMIVFVSGSSSFHGIGTGYLETLLGGEYFVVEYGTIRTTNNMVYMEAVANFVGEGDIVVYAPENSIYQFGAPELSWKLFRDLEGSQNVWRYIDVKNYTNLFGAFAEYQGKRWSNGEQTYSQHTENVDVYGDYQSAKHADYCENYAPDFLNNHGYFTVTLNEMVNTIATNTEQISLSNPDQWISITTYAADVRRILGKVTATGATVYFGFCPVNENALTETAKTAEQQAAYDRLIRDTYGIEVLGSCSDHLYRWVYMYKGSDGSDFHLNDYGRAINTYKIYTHLCEKLGLTPVGMKAYGEAFPGCLFEH